MVVGRPRRVVVIGAGISGLVAAHRLHDAGHEVLVLERDAVVGGKIGVVRQDGYLLERGPNSLLGSARALWPWIEALGLEPEMLQARGPGDRWVYRGGTLRRLPRGPLSALGGNWLDWGDRIRVARELFVPADPRDDETLYDFVARRCGPGFADGLIAPFTSGVYAGDPRQLGARDAFPRMWRLEAEGGGLIRGAVALARVRKAERGGTPARKGLWNFQQGLQTLPTALAASLAASPRARVEASATAVALRPDAEGVVVEVQAATGDRVERADGVVVALPPAAIAALLRPWAADAADALAATPMAPVAVVHLGGPDPENAAPAGFGALVARGEGIEALGVLVPSSLFAGRAPEGHALYAVFLGGVTAPELVDCDDATLIDLALRGRRAVFGPATDVAPAMTHVTRWQAAIPQYIVGHRRRVELARDRLVAVGAPIAIAGAGCDGISIDDAAASGQAQADALLARLEAA